MKSVELTNVGAGYAGDVAPTEAWAIPRDDPTAVLIDVRTDAEWQYVGTADLAALNKEPIFVDWQVFPHMQVNKEFVEELTNLEFDADQTLLFICRSGVSLRPYRPRSLQQR